MTVSIVRRAGSVRFHYKWWGLIFVLPVVTFFAAFNLFPTLFGLWLSFTDYDLLSPPVWVGLDNFANLIADRLFLQAFGNTLVFVLGATVPVWVLSLLAALVFDQAFRGRDILKAAFFLPVLAAGGGDRRGLAVVTAFERGADLTDRWLVGRHGDPVVGRRDARSVLDDCRARLGDHAILH